MAIKDNDFVEIDFTGKIKETGQIFDTTIKKVGIEGGLDPNAKYESSILCLGRGYIFEKIENSIKDSDIGKEIKIELSPEEGFGKKDAKLIQTMPTSAFRKENIQLRVGLNVTVNDKLGIVRTINGGRCMIDFNHPLSGKDLIYEVKVLKKIVDNKEKVSHIIKTELRIDDFKLEESKLSTGEGKKPSPIEKEKIITITFEDKISKLLTAEMKKVLIEKIKEITKITVKIK